MNYTDIVQCFEDRKECGHMAWICRCPCTHNHKNGDRNPSLKVWVDAKKGELRCFCYRGCKWREIVEATGTNPRDWSMAYRQGNTTQRRTMSRIVAQYIYRDENGELLFVVNRCEPKDFFQTRPMPGLTNAWATGLQEGWYVRGENGQFKLERDASKLTGANPIQLPKCRIVPYRLPELLARPSHPVLIVEGEKDVEAVEKLGIVATCNPMGTGKFTDECGKHLKGRRVTIVPDKDDVGLGHAYQVAAVCLRHRAATVRILGTTSDYWNAPGKDLSDWLATVPSVPIAKEKLIEWVKAEAEYVRQGGQS